MKDKNNLFQNLFVFDMANNHMGDVEHGMRIIRELHSATAEFDFPCAVKFQYRDLDTFIHPEYKSSFEFKYVKRFQETRLSDDELLQLKQEVDKLGFVSVCTPFASECTVTMDAKLSITSGISFFASFGSVSVLFLNNFLRRI